MVVRNIFELGSSRKRITELLRFSNYRGFQEAHYGDREVFDLGMFQGCYGGVRVREISRDQIRELGRFSSS